MNLHYSSVGNVLNIDDSEKTVNRRYNMTYKFAFNNLLVSLLLLAGLAIYGCHKVHTDSAKECENSFVDKGFKHMDNKNRIRLEHVAVNVEDPVGMVKWYCENLEMKVVKKYPPPANAHFICDTGQNIMLEVYNNPPDAVPDYASMDPLLFHIAFMVDDVREIRCRLIAAGATPVGDVAVTQAGDEIAMLRDPWGVPIQFVKRAKPMLFHK